MANMILKKYLKYIPHVLSVLVVCFLAFKIIPLYIDAQEIGNKTGQALGKGVGTAIGTYKGVTEGWQKGAADGKEEGLSAKDTKSEIFAQMESAESLQVMECNMELYEKVDNISKGNNLESEAEDYTNIKWAILYKIECTGTFTVDLSKAVIEETENGMIQITVPEPELQIHQKSSKKIKDYRKNRFSDAEVEDADKAITNAKKITVSEVEKKLPEYGSLKNHAKVMAKDQLMKICDNSRMNGKKIDIVFANERE